MVEKTDHFGSERKRENLWTKGFDGDPIDKAEDPFAAYEASQEDVTHQ